VGFREGEDGEAIGQILLGPSGEIEITVMTNRSAACEKHRNPFALAASAEGLGEVGNHEVGNAESEIREE
jgi:hypothetical protein